MCPVNSQNDEKLAYYAFSLANACTVARSTRRNFCLQAVDVQQFIWCQIARSTIVEPSTFGRGEEPSARSPTNLRLGIVGVPADSRNREMMVASSEQLTVAKVGLCDLTAH